MITLYLHSMRTEQIHCVINILYVVYITIPRCRLFSSLSVQFNCVMSWYKYTWSLFSIYVFNSVRCCVKFVEFYRKRFSRKLYMSVSHLPLFLLLEFVNFDCLFIYLFLLFCLFAKRTFDMCHSCTLRKYTRCAPHYILPNTNNLATYQVISTEKQAREALKSVR